jgi:hypothetical protein
MNCEACNTPISSDSSGDIMWCYVCNWCSESGEPHTRVKQGLSLKDTVSVLRAVRDAETLAHSPRVVYEVTPMMKQLQLIADLLTTTEIVHPTAIDLLREEVLKLLFKDEVSA